MRSTQHFVTTQVRQTRPSCTELLHNTGGVRCGHACTKVRRKASHTAGDEARDDARDETGLEAGDNAFDEAGDLPCDECRFYRCPCGYRSRVPPTRCAFRTSAPMNR